MDKLLTLSSDFETIARQIIDEATPLIKAAGYDAILVTSGRRTMMEQAKLYAQGRTAPGKIITKAPPGSSAHNFGKAFDFVLMKGNKPVWDAPEKHWAIVGAIARKSGCVWGGDFVTLHDMPHIECPSWRRDREEWRKGALKIP